jgi:hypothetical protein
MGYLMDCYASDPMGGGESLSEKIKASLAGELAKIPHTFSVICYVAGRQAGKQASKPAGLSGELL